MRAQLDREGRPARTARRNESRTSAIRRTGLAAAIAVLAMLVGASLALGDGLPAKPAPAPTPANTAAPALTGTPAPGQTLTCSPGSWSGNPSGFSYAWLRDGQPIAGQSGSTYVVQTTDQGHSISCQVTASNGGGEYTIVGLPSGSYKVSFYSYEGDYISQYFNGQAAYSSATPVSVTAPNATSGINAEMQAGGEISGKVTDATTHAAIAGVEACASAEISPKESAGSCATTNSAGEYTIVGLPSGTYTVSFYPYESNNLTATYPTGVKVTAPATTPNVNAELQDGGQITGKVTEAAVSKKAIGEVQVCAADPAIEYYGRCTQTNSAGEYTIIGLPTGKYEVTFDAQTCGENGCTEQNFVEFRTEVSVTAPNPAERNAELQPGGQIEGSVTSESGSAPIANVSVCANPETSGVGACATTDASGKYAIRGLEGGNYDVFFDAASTGYLSQSYGSAVSVIVSKTATADGKLKEGGKISGKVTAATTHSAIANVEVCGVESTTKSYEGCAQTNSAGEYSIVGLPTGTYELSFSAFSCTESGCSQLNYLRATTSGVSVTAPNATSGVNAELSPGGQITGRVTDASTHAGLKDVSVCAISESFSSCAVASSAAAASASAKSNALAVPAPVSAFKIKGKPKYNSKTGKLVFTMEFANAGKLSWSLFFRNADVGFADSLAISLGEGGPSAEAARKHHKRHKAKKCKMGFTKHKGKCVRTLVPFGSGTQNVTAPGTVKVEVPASKKALKALKDHHTLHVSGTFTFQSALGGSPSTQKVSTVVHPPKKKAKGKGKHGHSKRKKG
jgi:hypothetical protein